MEIGDEPVHHLEAVARGDENVRLAAAGPYQAVAAGGRFQGAQGGGAHRHHPAAPFPGCSDGRGGFFRHVEALAVHLVLVDLFHAHRLEGACPHMQRQRGSADTLLGEPLQHCLIEVQPGGGRCHGARVAGIDGLVAGLILRLHPVLDIGRQGQAAVLLGQVPQIAFALQFEGEELTLAAAAHQAEGVFQGDAGAGLGRLAGPHLGQGVALVHDALQQHFHLAAGVLLAEEAGLDHPGIVEHQQVAGGQQAGQVGEAQVGQVGAVHVQQAAGAAFPGRMLGDQFGRQGKVEKVDGKAHGLAALAVVPGAGGGCPRPACGGVVNR